MRVAMVSLHTSPLVQAGSGDAGGMNVYVKELSAALAHAGVQTTVYTRRWRADLPERVEVEPGFDVVHIPAGDPALPKEQLPQVVDEFTDALVAHFAQTETPDVVHANYWLSGQAGHRIKHELGLPLVTTFHTLARVKAAAGDFEPLAREVAEASIIGCADAICASCTEEESQLRHLYGNPPGRIEIVAPGVEHAFFAPGPQAGARQALGLPEGPMVLFVGRIQPLKGCDVAVRALAALDRPDATLVVVGGASGADGNSEVAMVHQLVDDLGLRGRVLFVPPQPHHILSTWYRSADVVMVPSRSESFGLVALEAAACGIPVVAAAVGGLRTLVDHGRTGFLVNGRDPNVFAAFTAELLDNPLLAADMSVRAAARSRAYTWGMAAARLRRTYADLAASRLVLCS